MAEFKFDVLSHWKYYRNDIFNDTDGDHEDDDQGNNKNGDDSL